VVVDPGVPGWTSRTWVPLVTAFLESGGTQCLVGTRALLGEGWDCPPVNVVIDLTAAATPTAVHQMRGRGLRLDPTDPRKVADDWGVVCIAHGHPQGGADHARFVRKHEHFFALNAVGEIESGVSHVDRVISPFRPPTPAEAEAIRARMRERPARREAVRAAWRIGEPYRDLPVRTLRVRLGRSPGLPGRGLLRGVAPDRTVRRPAGIAFATVVAVLVGAVIGGAVAGPIGAVLGVVLALGAGLALGLVALRDGLAALGPSDTLGDLGRAVADGLVGAGVVDPGSGAAAVRVEAGPDGTWRCRLDGATSADAARFAEALEEVVAPLFDPRWVIPRRLVDAPPTLLGAARVAAARLVGRARTGRIAWHAVPSAVSGRVERVRAFEGAWRTWVSPGAIAVRERDPMGQGVLAAHRGEDPFGVETQLRTLWT
jgi:hypothetical protein